MAIVLKHWFCDPPTATDVANAREVAGLEVALAAQVAGLTEREWFQAEIGTRVMSGASWALFLLATDQHPTLKLAAR